MPASHHIDKSAKLITIRWQGNATDIAVLKALINYHKETQNHPVYRLYNELLDITDVSNYNVTPIGLKHLSEVSMTCDLPESGKKLAILVNSTMVFGLVRMYEAYRNFPLTTTKQVRAFRSRKSAFKWLAESVS